MPNKPPQQPRHSQNYVSGFSCSGLIREEKSTHKYSMRKREADFAMALSLRSVSITELQQEPVLGEHPGDAPSSEGESGERRFHDHSANCLAEFQLFIQGLHLVTQVMQPATLLQETGNGRSFGSGFHQFYERKLRATPARNGILQRILNDL